MMNGEEGEWTQEERAAFERLSRERTPDPSLKERVRDGLRSRGKFGWDGGSGAGEAPSVESESERGDQRQAPDASRTFVRIRGGGRSWPLRIAAGLLLFLTGVLAGRLSSPPSPPAFAIATDPILAPAERVQATGTAYVETVARLVALGDSLPADAAEQGRGAAVSALRGAAEHAIRIPGLDAETQRALTALRAAGGS